MQKNIIFLSATNNYPLRFSAENSKNELIARGLSENNNKVTIINNPMGLKGQRTLLKGENTGVEYVVFPGVTGSKPGRLINNLRTIYRLLKEKRTDHLKNVLITEHSYFPFFLLYMIMARCLNYKIIVTLTEWHLYFKELKPVKRADFFLFDHFFGYFVHGIFPISTMLEQKVRHFKKPVLKVPILADFNNMEAPPQANAGGRYFLYCGHLGYYEVIEFIVKSYTLFQRTDPDTTLRLILSGPDDLLPRVTELIKKEELTGKVFIEQRLPFNKLMEAYHNALALLIPLRPQNQDRARFSHKIGEYLASGRPVITGAVGEIEYYFTHNKNAFVAVEYTAEAYAALMCDAAADPELANSVGREGRELGRSVFNYKSYGVTISDFLDKL